MEQNNLQLLEDYNCNISYKDVDIFYKIIKRLSDIVFSSIAAIILMPIVIITCICVILESKGPPIYKQERLGINGKPFMVYKIRSMKIDAEAISGPKWAESGDPRVTKVGRFIRNTRIDEIPQVINILKGEMSMVGPRPEREFFYKAFEKGKAPGYRKRLSVKPGLTGYAQVNGGYDLDPVKKFQLDMKYIKERSLIMDTFIILKTINILLTGNGAR